MYLKGALNRSCYFSPLSLSLKSVSLSNQNQVASSSTTTMALDVEAIDLKIYMQVSNNITRLFWLIMASIAMELMPNLGMIDFIAKHTFFMRLLFIVIHSMLLMSILKIALYSPVTVHCIVHILVSMCIAALVSVVGSFILSTIAAFINGIAWIITITIFVKKRWNEMVPSVPSALADRDQSG